MLIHRIKQDRRGLKRSATSGIDDCQIALESGPTTLAQHSRLVCSALLGKVLIYVEIGSDVVSSVWGL